MVCFDRNDYKALIDVNGYETHGTWSCIEGTREPHNAGLHVRTLGSLLPDGYAYSERICSFGWNGH